MPALMVTKEVELICLNSTMAQRSTLIMILTCKLGQYMSSEHFSFTKKIRGKTVYNDLPQCKYLEWFEKQVDLKQIEMAEADYTCYQHRSKRNKEL